MEGGKGLLIDSGQGPGRKERRKRRIRFRMVVRSSSNEADLRQTEEIKIFIFVATCSAYLSINDIWTVPHCRRRCERKKTIHHVRI